nr:MAG TPA: 2-vinyl bacteriochlorophyllide hydratase [Bacteriophage sp.]
MNRLRALLDILLSVNERDICGMILWLFLSLLASAMCGWKGVLFLLLVMVAREIWQYKVYHLPCFEWEDVVRYSLIILHGWMVIQIA